MRTVGRQTFARAQLLREDPDLVASIPAAERTWALDHCVVQTIQLHRGTWDNQDTKILSGGIGLLIIDGMMIRRVGIDGRFGAELLGEGDLLRPWQGEDLQSTLPHTTGWKVISEARLAVLDERAAARLGRYPGLIGALTGRALDRARRLALMMAIVHHPRIEVRLQMLFWHLADRWGHVRPDGVVLPLSLSHSVLADLVAAQRPSVTGALTKLGRRRLINSIEEGWLLAGGPPGELLELQDIALTANRQPPRATDDTAGPDDARAPASEVRRTPSGAL